MIIVSIEERLTEYRSRINQRLQDREEHSLCLMLFDFLTSKDSFKLNYVTYGTLMQIVQCSKSEFNLLVKATDFLTTRYVPLLDMHFEYYDDTMEDPEPVENADVNRALAEGVLYHPVSGETVANFSSYIYPVFRPSAELNMIRVACNKGGV
ncbi:hypothetical protein ACSTLJ_04755 [Vibrio parahaemolyticus]|nr:hypothetical protein [Vibrio parahaemolyticus]EGR1734739.1 hypothetical protein [Vibrio parahaemolyticus]